MTYPNRQLEEMSKALKSAEGRERIQSAKLTHQQSRYEKLRKEFEEFLQSAALAEAQHEEALGREVRQKELLWAQLTVLEEQQVAAMPDPAIFKEMDELKEMLTTSLLENEELSFSLDAALNENGHLSLELEKVSGQLEAAEKSLKESQEHLEIVQSQRDQVVTQVAAAEEKQRAQEIERQSQFAEIKRELKQLKHRLGESNQENERLKEELYRKRQQVLDFHLQQPAPAGGS